MRFAPRARVLISSAFHRPGPRVDFCCVSPRGPAYWFLLRFLPRAHARRNTVQNPGNKTVAFTNPIEPLQHALFTENCIYPVEVAIWCMYVACIGEWTFIDTVQVLYVCAYSYGAHVVHIHMCHTYPRRSSAYMWTLGCIGMHWYALKCMRTHQGALGCNMMHWVESGCIELHWNALECIRCIKLH